MAKGINITIFGDKELQKHLADLPMKVQRKLVKDAMKPGAEIIKAEAQSLSPVLSGRNRQFIKVRALSGKGFFGFKVITGKRGELGIPANDKYYYPTAVELGTDKRPARPFMRPATNRNRERILGMIADALRASLEL